MTAALIFDCDGVLADTERHGHLVAFNQVFSEAGLDVRWSVGEYRHLLSVAGGKERMRRALFLDAAVAARNRLPSDPAEQAALLGKWHDRKTQIFAELVASDRVPPRPGVARLATEAMNAGWRLAVASTASEPSVRAIVEHVLPQRVAADTAVFAGDIVAHKKPAPDIYVLALASLDVAPEATCVIEDSRAGLQAAVLAGCRVIITLCELTSHGDFSSADLVVPSLGGPGDEDVVTLGVVRRLLAQSGTASA